ncbi:hypothetical protein, partial [Escherichia coli]|uniref:hypothetical protein n=1 Tax=Escherichia coli TaxID=562 RepID=UPI001BC8B67D
GKISSDGCLKKEQMVVSAIASTPQITKHRLDNPPAILTPYQRIKNASNGRDLFTLKSVMRFINEH